MHIHLYTGSTLVQTHHIHFNAWFFNSMPQLTSVGHQWTIPSINGYIQMANIGAKSAPIGKSHLTVANTT